MQPMIRVVLFTLIGVSAISVFPVFGETVRIAVATNFLATMKEIVNNFEKNTGHTAIISSGSSGKLYAQIKHGAPFDVFFSADSKRPQLLEAEGLAVAGSRFAYAAGRITLWSADPQLIQGNGEAMLKNGSFEHLAIANPVTAPYGAAAKKTLERLNLYDYVKDRLVQGENIGQTLQFVFSGNAQLGFVALSQVLVPKINGTGSRWDVPSSFYDPLIQDAVLLKNGEQNPTAKAFLDYVKGAKAKTIIERFGYGVE